MNARHGAWRAFGGLSQMRGTPLKVDGHRADVDVKHRGVRQRDGEGSETTASGGGEQKQLVHAGAPLVRPVHLSPAAIGMLEMTDLTGAVAGTR